MKLLSVHIDIHVVSLKNTEIPVCPNANCVSQTGIMAALLQGEGLQVGDQLLLWCLLALDREMEGHRVTYLL